MFEHLDTRVSIENIQINRRASINKIQYSKQE